MEPGIRSDAAVPMVALASARSRVTLLDATVARPSARGRGIDDVDYLIAATALVLDAELIPTNVRHFQMLAGLFVPPTDGR